MLRPAITVCSSGRAGSTGAAGRSCAIDELLDSARKFRSSLKTDVLQHYAERVE